MDYKLQLPSALDYFTTLVQSDDEFPLMETAVSIAQDEVEIDLKVVNSDLIDIEKSIAGSLNQHNQFLKELGLPHLPIPKHQAETLI